MKLTIRLPQVCLWVGALLLGSFLIASCNGSTANTPHSSLTIAPQPNATELPITMPAVCTSTSTSAPLTRTITPTDLATSTMVFSTPTPLPALSTDEAHAELLELLRTNGGCQLPCWWGLTPGETSTQEAKTFLERYVNISLRIIQDDKGGNTQLLLPEDGLMVNPIIDYEINSSDQTVEQISVQIEIIREIEGGLEVVYGDPLFAQLMPQYTLSQILTAYGPPTDVLVRAIRGWWEFDLLLFYAEEGFLINYSAPYEEEGGVYFGCPTKISVEFWLWPPERNYTLAEAVSLVYADMWGQMWLSSYLPLEDATMLSLEDFYEIYRAPDNSSCLETPLELWPEP